MAALRTSRSSSASSPSSASDTSPEDRAAADDTSGDGNAQDANNDQNNDDDARDDEEEVDEEHSFYEELNLHIIRANRAYLDAVWTFDDGGDDMPVTGTDGRWKEIEGAVSEKMLRGISIIGRKGKQTLLIGDDKVHYESHPRNHRNLNNV